MELLVVCVEALGNIVAPVAWAFAAVMIVAIVTKTFLIYNDVEKEDLADWFAFLKVFEKKDGLR